MLLISTLSVFFAAWAVPTPPTAICPLKAFAPYNGAEAFVFNDANSIDYDSASWNATVYAPVDPNTVNLSEGVAVGASTANWGFGTRLTDGSLVAWGSTVATTGLPSGTGYTVVDSDYGAHHIALNSSGQAKSWGTTASGYITGAPIGTGYSVAFAGYNGACVGGKTNGGIVCWGNNIENMVSGAPTTGTYVAGDSARYISAGVKNDGTVTAWTTTRTSSGMVSKANELATELATLTGVKDISLSSVGDLVALVWFTDGTASVVWPASDGVPDAALHAPGGFDAGLVSTDWEYKMEGPDGFITFRTSPEINPYSSIAAWAGVFDDPMGLTDSLNGDAPFAYGDAVVVNSTAAYPQWSWGCEPLTW